MMYSAVRFQFSCSLPGEIDIHHIGYRWLYEECHVAHRDISHSNLMFSRHGSLVKGVLNDFDLASVGAANSPLMPSHGTGTRLFMAIELLAPPDPMKGMPPRFYRHDLESLTYVLLWHASRYDDGVPIAPSPYQRWGDPSIDSDILEAYKIRFIHSEEPQLTGQFEGMREWIQKLQALFRNGFLARRQARGKDDLNFSDETLGGVVTFDAFESICSESLQALSSSETTGSFQSAHL